jgi:hypothetical protein
MREIFQYIRVDLALEVIEKEFNKNPMIQNLVAPFIDKEKIKDIFTFGKSPEYLQFWKDYTNELIAQGVDLDKLTEAAFKLLMINKALEYFFKSKMLELENVLSRLTKGT